MLKNAKKWSLTVVSVTLIIIILFGISTYCIDPLVQYGKGGDRFTYWMSSEMYTNPGIAKNYEYDAVIVGSSMAQNNDVAEWNEKLGYNTLKMTYSAATTYNLKRILDVCFSSGNEIKAVYWNLDETALSSDYQTPRYPLPEYLYDTDKINDISYLLNLDVAYFYSLKSFLYTMKGETRSLDRGGVWAKDLSVYNKKDMLDSFDFPMEQEESKGELYFSENVSNNLKYNIIPLIEQHPDTQFNFYLVPYSVCFWYILKCEGTLDAHIYDIKTAIGEFLKYDNVKVYFFQNEKKIITNLDLYKDYSHYNPDINSYMLNKMADGQNRLDLDNYEQIIDEFHDYLNSFDYDSFIGEAKKSVE